MSLDFMHVGVKSTKNGIEVFPRFLMTVSKDLMTRGGDFYAIWDEERQIWSTNEDDVIRLVDRELNQYADENFGKVEGDNVNIKLMFYADTGSVDAFHKYCQKQKRDNFTMLDETLIFSNTEIKRENYASKRLDYPLGPGDITAYDKLMSVLYSEEERHKLEWAIGSIVSGDSKEIQKFMVLYGAAGTGKSTVLNIIQDLFDGYYCTFDAKTLGANGSSFALEQFSGSPLVAIQHDGDLSRIEDNTRLNSLVSHEEMMVNEKFKKAYSNRFKCFLFMGTNKPVKITDGKSGLLRRLIDVTPTGKKMPRKEYEKLMKQVKFELGAIAQHCLDVYLDDPGYYDAYTAKSMLSASNDFYNFVADSFSVFRKNDGTTLKAAWEMYKTYNEEAMIQFPHNKRVFKEELKNYFWDYYDSIEGEDGTTLRSYYKRFRVDIFEDEMRVVKKEEPVATVEEKKPAFEIPDWLIFKEQPSLLDEVLADCPAQYASDGGTPMKKWENATSVLRDLDTSKLHYAKPPVNHIVVDFDMKDENGEKCFEKNVEAASKWPATYAETSKSGGGIHLHYIYAGDDVEKLSRVYDEDIEIKVFNGGSSLRRMLTKCNDIPIATISSGLPQKEVKNVINAEGIKNEKHLRALLKKHINKEIMIYTKPSIDMIKKLLDEAYESGIGYDVSDLKNSVFALAASSNNQAEMCLKIVGSMKWKSEEPGETVNESGTDDLVFYDVEVFPNLFLVNYKMAGEGRPVVRLINPRPEDIEQLIKFKLVGFNNRSYDNHMIWACLLGYTNMQLYQLSQNIINAEKGDALKYKFGEAYNLSYADVYDFSAKKQSLKKFEIELGIKHHELGLDWDKPVPEELWDKVAEYCDDDVLATEAVFNARHADFTTRQLLADLSGLKVNDTNRKHITEYIFEGEKKPELVYTDLATGEQFPGR